MRKYTLLSDLVENAEEIRQRYNNKYITALSVIAAAADICKEKYKGITRYDLELYPERFPEERLRQMFEAVFVHRPSIVSIKIRRKIQNDNEEYKINFLPRALKLAEEIAKQRGKTETSAETLLLIAASTLEEEERKILKSEYSEGVLPIVELLKKLDDTFANKIIDDISAVIERLQHKITTIEKIRDWKPATRFDDPEEFKALLKSKIHYTFCGAETKITFDKFFGGEQDLHLTVTKVDNVYYIHDNGGSISFLKRHIDKGVDYKKCVQKVCSKKWIDNDRVYGRFTRPYTFAMYLSDLIFVANADLVADKMTQQKIPRSDATIKKNSKNTQIVEVDDFLVEVIEQISVKYDENKGVSVGMMIHYPNSSSYAEYDIAATDEKEVTITDRARNMIDGSIFETYYIFFREIEKHKEFINHVAGRFGAHFDGTSITLSGRYKDSEDVAIYLIKFINAAILLCEMGNKINPLK